ncbi:MAG: tryptophan--tRNA ligase [Halorhodospira halophila]|uniref:tryptophan--tRNA ligase n=2 Tax=Halorhodospira TaxID=85108 RepID=UPI00191385AB|nr:tryptophan--tRNA ligase [Halorhodospira halophila]MBK5942905.1 tryptophan--tRNA ligase [Halorhodospira halophila]MCC3750455.1 tryptophan--tRNA ligase [Halorhodospira halophila]MCG5528727.1 tryptophan--tRNA ligase [Halorhodospira halophila]
MANINQRPSRVLSGMRPTGRLHLGHYHGVLKNWVRLQNEYECFFFVADWHALTTHYESPWVVGDNVWDMVIDWLACGVNPKLARLFIQSRVPEHAELHLLLSMMTPLGWLERVPTFRDQQEQLSDRDLSTYGFLGYPLLQSADVLIYKATEVPVGEDQVAHLELTREVARRFNHLYGVEPDFEQKAQEAARKMGKKNARLYHDLRRRYQQEGDREALEVAHALLEGQPNITVADRERLFGYLDGTTRELLPEPEVLLTPTAKMPGLDGRKMSKSYDNTIGLREPTDDVVRKLRTMPTDPARVRRNDPGDPQKCPVWDFHQVYSDESTRAWVQEGCTTAGIGCLECKRCIIDAVEAELSPIRERARQYEEDPEHVRSIIVDGCEQAREEARETLGEVRSAMGLEYR